MLYALKGRLVPLRFTVDNILSPPSIHVRNIWELNPGCGNQIVAQCKLFYCVAKLNHSSSSSWAELALIFIFPTHHT